MNNPFSLEGKLAVITGGGTGLGFGIARVFVRAGARVVIIGRRKDVLQKAKTQLGDACEYRVFDINDKKKVPTLVKDIEENVGAIDTLVNCAGVHLKKPVWDVTDEEFSKVLDVHVISTFAICREVLKPMLARKRGNIIMISSMTAVMGMEKVVAYSAAKSAVIGMMRAIIADTSSQGIRVNTIAPGWIDTPMLHKAIDNDAPRKAKILNRIPTRTFGSPDDIGYAALYLSSEAGKYINGVFLPVDAGAAGAF